jgi:hypothetical protein
VAAVPAGSLGLHEAVRAVEFASELEHPIDRLKLALHRHRMRDDDFENTKRRRARAR